jgi:hypothetical protein
LAGIEDDIDLRMVIDQAADFLARSNAVNDSISQQTSGSTELTIDGEAGHTLMSLRALPPMEAREAVQPSSSFLAALHTLGMAMPEFQAAIGKAASAGEGLLVAFPPHVVKGLRDGTLRLMKASDGHLPTAIDGTGRIVAQARLVGAAGAGGVGGVAGGVAAGATAGALAVAALPILIASAAAYAQQRQLERSLASIKAVVERIEERLEDTDTGVCEAAEQFLALVEDCLVDGGLTDYLRLELATQRTAVEALYSARKRWVGRFKKNLEREQIERERSKGRGQPWVDAVISQVKGGKLEQELTLFIRSLLSRTKLSILVAVSLAEEGRGTAAMKLIGRTETELRSEFFDLHRRLVPLARIEPEQSMLQKLPGMGNAVERAHETVRLLVDHLNDHVLPMIPDPDDQREVHAILSPTTVTALASGIA